MHQKELLRITVSRYYSYLATVAPPLHLANREGAAIFKVAVAPPLHIDQLCLMLQKFAKNRPLQTR